jgi:hypothetical protein
VLYCTSSIPNKTLLVLTKNRRRTETISCLFHHELCSFWLNWYNRGVGGVESNWVHSALRPLIGLLCQPWVIMMMEKLVEWWLAKENEVLRGNLPQCRFVHCKPHMLYPDTKPARRGGKPATNRLNYGTAHKLRDLLSFLYLHTKNVRLVHVY